MPPGVDHVDSSDTFGTVRFVQGQLALQANADTLTLRVEAADEDSLRRLQDGVGARLHKIGRRDQLTLTWHRLETSPESPGHSAHGTDPAAGPGGGKRRWRSRIGWVGLVGAGALIVAAHVGLGGAVLATAAWTGWVDNVLLASILGTVVFLAAHVIAGRYAFRRGKAVHAHWKLRRWSAEPTSATGPAAAAEERSSHQEGT